MVEVAVEKKGEIQKGEAATKFQKVAGQECNREAAAENGRCVNNGGVVVVVWC